MAMNSCDTQFPGRLPSGRSARNHAIARPNPGYPNLSSAQFVARVVSGVAQ